MKMKTKSPEGERGSLVPLIAVGMASLIGVMGLALDVQNLVVAKSQLKSATDAAAMAGAAALTNPSGGSVPNFSLASTTVSAALSNLQNKSNGTVVYHASAIETGGWDITGAHTSIQVWTSTGNLIPAVAVTTQKVGINAPISSFFSRIFGINFFTPSVRSVAIGDFSPSTADAGQLLPLALSQCVYDQFWDSSTQKPKLATQTTPICPGCPNQTIGQPFVVRIGSNWGSNVIIGETSSACPATGIWTTFSTGSNADSVVSGFMTGYNQKISLGDSIWLYQTQGAKANLYTVLQGLGMPLGAVIPVISGNATPGTWANITAYACVKIVSSTGGNTKAIDLQLLPVSNVPVSGISNSGFDCMLRGTGTSNKSYLTSPPVLVN